MSKSYNVSTRTVSVLTFFCIRKGGDDVENDRYVGRDIKRVSNCIRRAFTLRCKDVCGDDITTSNCWLLMYLYDHSSEDIFQKDIEEKFSIRRSTSSSIISLLEKKGYIERVSVERDARLRKLVLTDKALDICDVVHKRTLEFEESLIEGISDEEIELFYNVLLKIRENAGML